MNKPIVLFIMQMIQTLGSIGLWLIISLIWHKVKYKSLKGFCNRIGLKKPPQKILRYTVITISISYIFTVFVYITLKIVKGGMHAQVLLKERECMPLPLLLITILLLGVRSGFGEELFFRGLIANQLFHKMKRQTANILQAAIFTLPHIYAFFQLDILESIFMLGNAFVIGLALGRITYKAEGSILPSIICHGVINIIAVPITWYLVN